MKNIKLNLVSLLNAAFGFLYFFLIAKFLGFSKESDAFLTALTVCTYISFIVAAAWEGFAPFYGEYEGGQKSLSFNILAIILIFGFFVFAVTYLLSSALIEDELLKNSFSLLSITIVTLNLQNFTKTLFSLQKRFEYFYIIDLSLNFLLCIGMLWLYFYEKFGFLPLLYLVSAAHICISALFLFLLYKSGSFEVRRVPPTFLKMILKASLKNKIGGLMYGAKEPILAKILLIFGDGVYTAYSYASKFLASVFAVAVAPQINVFSINALEAVKNRDTLFMKGINKLIANSLVKYLLFAAVVYLFSLFAFFVTDIAVNSKLFTEIYLSLLCLYAVTCVEAPYSRLLPAFKAFDEIMAANFSFILFFGAFSAIAFLYRSIELTFFAVIFAQILIAFIYYRNAKKRLNHWNLA